MSSDFWQGKRVFITGHTGFKGSWLSLWLQTKGALVSGYSLEPPTKPNLFELTDVAVGMESNIGDVRDYSNLKEVVKYFRPDIVFHMAAQPLVRLSYDLPIETYDINVMGTVHLFEAIRQVGGVRAVINITSDKCYENKEWFWSYRENEPMGGYDVYSNSKGCSELVTAAYRNSYFNPRDYDIHGLSLASVRAGNVIGGGDWAEDRLIPDFLRAMEAEQPVVVRSPTAIRPWQHVLEPLSGYMKLAEYLWCNGADFASGWNFGPAEEDAKSVEWIVEQMVAMWGGDASWLIEHGKTPHEANYLKLDCSKAKARLEWYPRWELRSTLQRIVDWHKAYLDGADMRVYTLREIEKYEDVGEKGCN